MDKKKMIGKSMQILLLKSKYEPCFYTEKYKRLNDFGNERI